MFIILINESKVVEIINVKTLEISMNNEKPSIVFEEAVHGEGKVVGVNADYFVVDNCNLIVFQEVNEEDLNELKAMDRKQDFLK